MLCLTQMRAAVTGLALILAIVGGVVLFGSYLLSATHSETGALGSLLNASWFMWLAALAVIAILIIGGFATMILRRF